MTKGEVPTRSAVDVGVLAALVIAYGLASQRAGSKPWQVPANLAAALGAVVLVRKWGASWAELGLERAAVPRGLRLGIAAIAPVGAVLALGLALPATRRMFADERVAGSSGRELAFQAFVRIPLGTAAAEELLFRSALLGLALHRHQRARAVASTAIVFGLWHVLPALRSHKANPAGARVADRVGGRTATMVATVAATAAAGAGFAWLRLRSRSVVAPIVAHAGVNLGALGAAAWVAHRDRSARR